MLRQICTEQVLQQVLAHADFSQTMRFSVTMTSQIYTQDNLFVNPNYGSIKLSTERGFYVSIYLFSPRQRQSTNSDGMRAWLLFTSYNTESDWPIMTNV